MKRYFYTDQGEILATSSWINEQFAVTEFPNCEGYIDSEITYPTDQYKVDVDTKQIVPK